METVREIIETLGAENIAQRLGVQVERVTVAKYGKKIPASWFDALEQMAEVSLPRELFSFK